MIARSVDFIAFHSDLHGSAVRNDHQHLARWNSDDIDERYVR
jgi:hypothetical protein